MPYRSASQRRKAAAASSEKSCGTWQPSSLSTCQSASAGWSSYRSAMVRVMRTAYSRYTGDDTRYACRPPGCSTVPSASTGSSSGCLRVSHGRRAGGRRGQRDLDARGGEPVEHVVEPAEVVLALPRLQLRPAEDADADQRDAGLLHELDVLDAGGQGPLLGVVVAAVLDHRVLVRSAVGRQVFDAVQEAVAQRAAGRQVGLGDRPAQRAPTRRSR